MAPTTSSQPSTVDCTTGGSNFFYPSSNAPWAGKSWVGIEGNDTSSTSAFSECCSNEPVQYLAPCVLWCELGDEHTLGQMKQCWADNGFSPQAVEGSSTPSQGGSGAVGMTQGEIAGLVVGIVVVLTGLAVMGWKYCRSRSKGESDIDTNNAKDYVSITSFSIRDGNKGWNS